MIRLGEEREGGENIYIYVYIYERKARQKEKENERDCNLQKMKRERETIFVKMRKKTKIKTTPVFHASVVLLFVLYSNEICDKHVLFDDHLYSLI